MDDDRPTVQAEQAALRPDVERLQGQVHRLMLVQMNMERAHSTRVDRLEKELEELRGRVASLTLLLGARIQPPASDSEATGLPSSSLPAATTTAAGLLSGISSAATAADSALSSGPPPPANAADAALLSGTPSTTAGAELTALTYDVYIEDEHGTITRTSGPLSDEISTAINTAAQEWNETSLANYQTSFKEKPVLPSLQCIDRRVRKSSSLNYLRGDDYVMHYACFNCVRGGKPCVRQLPGEGRPILCLLPPEVRPSDAKIDELAFYVCVGGLAISKQLRALWKPQRG
ncbi:hypothetical protein M8818_001147 [Zalaria obscura]|uniref:Uncharacterized protein n=1 Tax=Zalaria obscura TaxID=2024903 RepID=A0ACC3SL99_9PEZI